MAREKDSISGFDKNDARATGRPGAPAPLGSAVRGSNLCGPNDNPIMRAAAPLLLLLGRLRAGLLRAPATRLLPHIAAAIERCERDMIAAKVPPATAKAAKRALAATADEVLADLPGFDRNPATLPNVRPGAGRGDGALLFFDALERIKADPSPDVRLLELLHACLALGFQGAQQALPGGAAPLQFIRRDIYARLRRAAPPPPRDLSPRWRGQPHPSRALRVSAPFWVAAGLVGLLVFGVFMGLRVTLSDRAEAVALALTSVNPPTPVSIGRKTAVAPPPALPETPVQTAQLDHIRTVLEPDIAAGRLSVDATPKEIVIRIPDRVLFQPGRTTLRDVARPLLSYIALALDADDSALRVVGRADERRMSNARFATNFELSLDRAKAVAVLLRQSLSHPERVAAEGKGADAPIPSNDASDDPGKTRRIEIIALRSD
jgi:type VI secretion system protein ImpK